jgi:hypothetical protein
MFVESIEVRIFGHFTKNWYFGSEAKIDLAGVEQQTGQQQ